MWNQIRTTEEVRGINKSWGCKKEIVGQWFHFAFLVLRPFFGGTVIASMMFNSSAVGGDAGNGWFNRQPNLHSKVTLHTYIIYIYYICVYIYLRVSKNEGTPQWMVYNGNHFEIDDSGVLRFQETSIIYIYNTSMHTLLRLPDWFVDSVERYFFIFSTINRSMNDGHFFASVWFGNIAG
jgi:hypothetical protein